MILKSKISGKDALRLSLVVLAFLAVFVCFTGNSDAATINVGSGAGNDSATIQGAVNTAGTNDVIYVYRNGSGTYNENVNIQKSNLTLQAASGEDVRISSTTTKTLIKISGTFSTHLKYVTIDGFNLIGTGVNGQIPAQGIGLLYADFCTLTNNIITNHKDAGIEVNYAKNNTVSNNRINGLLTGGTTYSGYGIRQGTSSTGNAYLGNTLTENTYGIGIVDGSNSTVSNNHITIPEIANPVPNIYGKGIIFTPNADANQVNIINNNTITKLVKTTSDTTGISFNGPIYSQFPTNNVVNNLIYSNDITNLLKGIDFTTAYSNNWNTAIFLNRIYNNTYGIKAAISTLSQINATNNWWGKNSTPTTFTGTTPAQSYDIWRTDANGNLSYNPWIVLNINATPNTILTGQTSTITADLTKNSNNEDTTTIYPGKYVPNGITTAFAGDALGTVNPLTANTLNGKATTTFTGNSPGISTVSATVDAQTVNTDVTINTPTADIDVTKNFYYEDLGPIIFPDNPLDRYWKFFSEVIVTNNGPDTATNVKITDLLGTGMELAPFDIFGSWFVTYTGQNPDLDPPENNPSFDPLTMIWTIPTMNNGDVWVLDFFTIANTTGTVNNTATFDPATADQYDPNTTNNVGFAETYVPTAQTQLTKWYQNNSTYGSPHTTTAYYLDNLYAFIKLYNNGPDTAKYITIIDDFTGNLIYNSALMETSYDGGLTWDTDPNAYWLDFGTYSELEWFPNDIALNGMALFRIPAQVNVSNTTITNNATETQRTFNPDGDNTDNPPINQPGFNTINTTTTLNVPLTPTAITVNPATGFKGDIVDLIATLTDTHNNIPLAGQTIQFNVDGNPVGTATTNALGIATLQYTITQTQGIYTILAEFLQDNTYAASSNTNTLTVDRIPTAIVVDPVSGFKGDIVDLIATLTDTHNNIPLAGQTIQFNVDGNPVGTATTNALGIATLQYTITQTQGIYTILAEFLQDNTYAATATQIP